LDSVVQEVAQSAQAHRSRRGFTRASNQIDSGVSTQPRN